MWGGFLLYRGGGGVLLKGGETDFWEGKRCRGGWVGK